MVMMTHLVLMMVVSMMIMMVILMGSRIQSALMVLQMDLLILMVTLIYSVV